ncbi:glycosyltransferase family 9 protein [Roseisolibacter agri]|uniref:ADP-heptose--LPS heptosyltransferase II n=1 Tax=Roseisolibacter agri TaxID=2014610 RepID=A0AA37QD43_9BACT|nr:glycosyltransferase family 9 protein [Roseisolibacter agri]GLC28127.1 ADP-heptose--LPS heptosyltransferase II [Roseisolibacter agri]
MSARATPAPTQASLVVQTSFLGDVVLTTPLIAALGRRGPVDVVVRPDAAALLRRHPDVRQVIVYDKRGKDRGVRGMLRVARAIRALPGPDGVSEWGPRDRVAYMAQGSPRSAALALLGGCAERVGFDSSRQARPLYTRIVAFDPSRHHAARLWSLAAATEDAGVEVPAPRLAPGADEVTAVDGALGELAAGGFVAVAPGSVWATKRWPEYPALAAALAADLPVVVVGGPGDRELAAAIVAACPPGRALDVTGRLSLLASTELLRRAALLVTNDSAPQHLASAVGTPTLTIFGPTVPEFGFGPLAPGSRTAGVAGLVCRPCDPHGPARCPLGHWRCMREQGADAIVALARAQLREPRPSST